MKISCYGIKSWEADYLKEKIMSDIPGSEVFLHERIVTKDDLPEDKDADTLCVFVDSSVTREVIDSMPNLKLIVTRSTGFDHIDIAYAKERGITVSYVPSYGENTVAEFAFALILALSRKIFPAFDNIKETGKYSFEGLTGFDLRGKTIGVIGTGRIGKHSIKMAKGFDMKVVAYDPFPNQELANELQFEYMSFEDVLKLSDVVTIHVPLSPETNHMFNSETIPKMKKGAILINTARGPIVDTKSLVLALQSGHLGGAGLDVLEEEGILKDEMGAYLHGTMKGHDLETVLANHILVDMPNVILTPHAAFNTVEAIKRILDTTVLDMVSFINNDAQNVVKS